MIDTHCHLHFNGFEMDREVVYDETFARGVFMIAVGTQSSTSVGAVEFARGHEGVWAAVGLHPSHTYSQIIQEDDSEGFVSREEVFDADFYKRLIDGSSDVVAIGEIGLDYYRLPDVGAEEVIEAQKAAFRAQLDFADEMGLPVILHVREAHDDAFAIIEEYLEAGKLDRKGVVHCFTGTVEEALRWHRVGFLTGFTGIVGFGGEKDEDGRTELQRAVIATPDDMFLVETDAPYLAPTPHRGRRCEPWMVADVASKVAELRGVDVSEVETSSDRNAVKLFEIELNC